MKFDLHSKLLQLVLVLLPLIVASWIHFGPFHSPMDQGSKQKHSWDVLTRFFPFICIRHELHITFNFRQDRSSLSESPLYVHRMKMFVPFVALLRESSFVSHLFGGTCGR